MRSVEEFEFWCGEYLGNPRALDSETRRLLAVMCEHGNPYAVAYFDHMEREKRRASAEIGDADDLDLPLNTTGNLDEKELDLSNAPARNGSDYPGNWFEIAIALKTSKDWRCEICSFQKQGSSLIQVHHIDGDKSDNQVSNLQVLCAKCHGEKHANPPVWPIGVSEQAQAELLSYHRSRRFGLSNKRGTFGGGTSQVTPSK